MIVPFFQIQCDACGVCCGGVFRDLVNAEGLREALGWTRIEYPQTLGNLFSPEPLVRHYCPSCWRIESTATPSRVVPTWA